MSAARRVLLPRLHLVELEDLPWWPVQVRDLATDYLHAMETWFAMHRPVVPLLAEALRASGQGRIVDLCSGGAGPLPGVVEALHAEGLAVEAVLTDAVPNAPGMARVAGASGGRIAFERAPVDARAVPPHLAGFRTVFNAFHHFAPADARAVLADAARAGAPIGVFEVPERTLRMLVPLLFTPLYVALTTPFIRPLGWRRLLWTYVVPLVPLTCWWDGLVSTLRAYTAEELAALGRAAAPEYRWRAGRVPMGRQPGDLTFLIGLPG